MRPWSKSLKPNNSFGRFQLQFLESELCFLQEFQAVFSNKIMLPSKGEVL